MSKIYQLEVTRAVRAERPTEAQILEDSLLVTSGQACSQDVTKDCYFRFSGDFQGNMVRLLSGSAHNPYWIKAGEGWRCLEYPHSEKYTYAKSKREGSKIILSVIGEAEVTDTEYPSVADAETAILALNPSDGFLLFDEGDDTQVIYGRPCLWKTEQEGGIYQTYKEAGSKCLFPNRQENDRY